MKEWLIWAVFYHSAHQSTDLEDNMTLSPAVILVFVPSFIVTFRSWWIDSVLKRTLHPLFVRLRRTTRTCVISEFSTGIIVKITHGLPTQRSFRAESIPIDLGDETPECGVVSLRKLAPHKPLRVRLLSDEETGEIVSWSPQPRHELIAEVGMVRRALRGRGREGTGILVIDGVEVEGISFAASCVGR